jgi:hypothetical protein
VIDVVKALHEKIIGLVDIGIQPRSRFDEPARGFTLVGHIFFGEKISRLFAFRVLWRRLFCCRGIFAGSCGHGKMLADSAKDTSGNGERAKKLLTAEIAGNGRRERKALKLLLVFLRALCVISLRTLIS